MPRLQDMHLVLPDTLHETMFVRFNFPNSLSTWMSKKKKITKIKVSKTISAIY